MPVEQAEERMNILHISTRDSEGAGSFAYFFHNYMVKHGYNSRMLVMRKNRDDDTVYQVSGNRLTRVVNRLIEKVQNWLNLFGADYYFFDRGRYNINSVEQFKPYLDGRPDIIFVYWISKFVSISTIRKLQSAYNAKVYWFIVDKAPFTGGCHYVNECSGYLKACEKCPAVPVIFRSIPVKNYRNKKNALENMNVSVLYPALWEKDLLLESPLFHNIEKLYMPGIAKEDRYYIKSADSYRSKHGLSNKKKIILFGSVRTDEKRKGFEYFIESIRQYQRKYSIDDVLILTIGLKKIDFESYGIRIESLHLGLIGDIEELAEIYNMSNVFVSPILEDMGPTMLLESMMCGTPVVAFRVGCALDVIIHNVTGYFARYKDSGDIADGIHRLLHVDDTAMRKMGEACREAVLRAYSLDTFKSQLEKILTPREHAGNQ